MILNVLNFKFAKICDKNVVYIHVNDYAFVNEHVII